MIPIISVSSLIAAVFFIIISSKFYSAHKKSGDKILSHLYRAVFSIGIGLLIISSAGLITKNLKAIDFLYDIYTFFFVAGMAYFTNITFEILGWQKVKKIIFGLLIISGLIVSVIPALNFNDAKVGQENSLIFWEDTRGAFMNNFMGILMTLPSLWFTLFFLWNSVFGKERFAKIRALLMAIGMFFWIAIGITDYVIGELGLIYISLFTTVFGFLFVLFFLFAINVKKPAT